MSNTDLYVSGAAVYVSDTRKLCPILFCVYLLLQTIQRASYHIHFPSCACLPMLYYICASEYRFLSDTGVYVSAAVVSVLCTAVCSCTLPVVFTLLLSMWAPRGSCVYLCLWWCASLGTLGLENSQMQMWVNVLLACLRTMKAHEELALHL